MLVKTATGSGKKIKDTGITSQKKLDDVRKVYQGSSYQPEGELVEKKMTKKDIEKRDEIADSMPKKDFKDRYGDDAESVMYGAATNIVKKQKKKKKKKVLSASYNMDKDVTESGLIIQDWNKDDIKYTEIETVDVIKPKPIKEEHSDWRSQLDADVLYRLGEDWQKVNRKDKTDGLSKKAVKAYRRENPGSKLQTAVTTKPSKLKKGSKSAKRRLSFCRRMKGMKKRLTSAKTARDPDSRINKALRRWNC